MDFGLSILSLISCGRSPHAFIPSMISVLSGTIPTHSAGTNFGVECVVSPHFLSSLDGPKLHTRKPGRSSKNRHSPQASVHELSLHRQRHQFHNEPRGHVQTRITLTCNTIRGLSQRHHLARAALGRSSAQVALNRSSRGDGRGGDLWVGWIDYNLLFSES